MATNPIGFFDSGVGGTSIWKEVIQLLPNENTIYLADSINAPYGIKTKQEIINLCIKNTELLIKKGAKIIVIACNTATTNAINYLRNHYDIPFIGIEPAIKPAALASKNKTIGILATKGTLSSDLFHKNAEQFTNLIEVIEQEGTGLVPLIENNQIESIEMEQLLQQLLLPMQQKNIDHLVLGCSHYPYLIPKIKKILSKEVIIIDSGFAVAKQTRKILTEKKLLNTNKGPINQLIITNYNKKTLKDLIGKLPNTNIIEQDF